MDYKIYVGFAILSLVVVTETSNVTVTVIEGNDAILSCSSVNTSDAVQVNWTNPHGQQLTHDTSILMDSERFNVDISTWDLRIKNTSFSDSGEYICKIFNNSLIQTYIHSTELTVIAPPTKTTLDKGVVNETTQSPTTEDPSKCSDSRSCQNYGSCENGTCNCNVDFTGIFCETPTVCPPGVCNINNTRNCTVEQTHDPFQFRCKCHPLYKGKSCETYDYCEIYPCQNRGICELDPNPSGYICHCPTGDPNNNCTLNTEDNCVAKPPSDPDAYITCVDQIDSYKMYCSPGFFGDKTGCSLREHPGLYCNRHGPEFCKDEGYCKPLCNTDVCSGTKNCQFTADPYNTTGFHNNSGCIKTFGDGYHHPSCSVEDLLFDGFDQKLNALTDCSPFFDTICTRHFGNGDCKPECNNEDCLYDGFDCPVNQTELAGVIIIELKGSLGVNLSEIQKNISMMMRSGVNITQDYYDGEALTLLSLKITDTEFSNIDYAGKFLAAVVAKRPGWLDGVQIKDIFVCAAGSYSSKYPDKCRRTCSTCQQFDDVCDWKTGECLHGCPTAHWGRFCQPCDRCKQEGEVCDWGNGECLHGCISNEFYGPKCLQCPQNCVGGCNQRGKCNTCSSGTHGDTCESTCDKKCEKGACDRTGSCACQSGYYWSDNDKLCTICSTGCKNICVATSGSCECKTGYHGSTCTHQCNRMCLDETCYVNGTCDKGCDLEFYGPMCTSKCPTGCTSCEQDSGLCEGNCEPGYEGSRCKASSKKSGYVDDVTDNTGVIIGVLISLLLVVLILVVACCYWKKRQSGDYVMEDEEMDEPPPKDSDTAQVHTNMHMQPTSPLLGHSIDLIELDEKQNIAVYAGPGRGTTVDDGEKTPNGKGPEDRGAAENGLDEKENAGGENAADGNEEDSDNKAEDTSKQKERCTSSVVMELGSGGRVLSVSDGDEVQSPTLNKEVEVPIGEEMEENEDDSAFADPPHSPLGEVRAPLASEENILASLGPTEMVFDAADEPVGLDEELEKEAEEISNKSRSSSSSSSGSKSSKSSKSSKEITTEM